MRDWLPTLIRIAGVCQLGVLIASAIVPFRLQWRTILVGLPRLHQQMYWIYGGYVVLAIVSFGLICLFNAHELGSGTMLARSICGYIAIFWGIRLSLQPVLDVQEHITVWWLHAGYHALTVLFIYFTVVFGLAALWP